MFGSLLTSLVNKGTSLEKFPSKPNIVLLMGSVPKFAFCVRGLSCKFSNVPETIKSSLN